MFNELTLVICLAESTKNIFNSSFVSVYLEIFSWKYYICLRSQAIICYLFTIEILFHFSYKLLQNKLHVSQKDRETTFLKYCAFIINLWYFNLQT